MEDTMSYQQEAAAEGEHLAGFKETAVAADVKKEQDATHEQYKEREG